MKKSVLVTSILFSTMMFGGQNSVNAATVANEQGIEENYKVHNNIVLIDQKGEHIATSIEGKVGEKCNLYDFIPGGYEIKGDKFINIISDVEKPRYVNVKALHVKNILKFVDSWTGWEIVGTYEVKGDTGDEIIIPDSKIPKGYYLPGGNRYTLNGNSLENEVDVRRKPVHEEQVAIIFNFYDENNNFLKKADCKK